MARFGNYAVRYAPSSKKSEWVVEIHRTARAALTAAKALTKPPPGARETGKDPVAACVFDMSRWGKKPVCIKFWGGRWHREKYAHGPSGLKAEHPGGAMKRLALDRNRMPVVKLDGYGRRRKARR